MYSSTAALYDFITGHLHRPDVEFYLDQCRRGGGHVLELGCGTGRVLLPIAEAGLTITGLDPSRAMLGACREKLRGMPPSVQGRVTLIEQRMQETQLDHPVNTVIAPFRSVQHLIRVEDQLACLSRINAAMPVGGRFIFDTFQVDMKRMSEMAGGEEDEVTPPIPLPDGGSVKYCGRVAATHRAEQYNDIELIYYLTRRDGTAERLVDSFPWRYYFRFELEHLLQRCGFNVVDLFGDFDLSPLDDNSPEMIFVAEKRREAPVA